MKKIIVSLFYGVALLFAATAQADSFTLSNIQYWVGSGTNESAFVLSWNDGKTPESLVWGYRWNTPTSGPAPTVLDMLQAIDTADSRLLITAHPVFNTPSFYAIYSVYYDLTGNGGSPVIGSPINLGGAEDGYAPDAGDHYKEGWITGFWGELIGVGNPYSGGFWTADYPAVTGVGTDLLTNNGWYGESFSTDETNYSIPDPGFPTAAAIPEPSSMAFLALGASGLLIGWRRKRSLRAS